jgi:hypothetical protein
VKTNTQCTRRHSKKHIHEKNRGEIYLGILLNCDSIIILNRRFEYILIRKYIYLKYMTIMVVKSKISAALVGVMVALVFFLASATTKHLHIADAQ